MQPHQERVVAEKNELDAKRDKLRAFFGTDLYRELVMTVALHKFFREDNDA